LAASELTNEITIVLPGDPVGKARPRFARGAVYTPTKTRDYETALAWAAKTVMGNRLPLRGPLAIDVVATMRPGRQPRLFPTVRPDLDNVLKTLDAFNSIVWHDDAQVVQANVRKVYGDNPSLRVTVKPISP
jgi:Holliday junction resolvase RusA-like endonuclease